MNGGLDGTSFLDLTAFAVEFPPARRPTSWPGSRQAQQPRPSRIGPTRPALARWVPRLRHVGPGHRLPGERPGRAAAPRRPDSRSARGEPGSDTAGATPPGRLRPQDLARRSGDGPAPAPGRPPRADLCGASPGRHARPDPDPRRLDRPESAIGRGARRGPQRARRDRQPGPLCRHQRAGSRSPGSRRSRRTSASDSGGLIPRDRSSSRRRSTSTGPTASRSPSSTLLSSGPSSTSSGCSSPGSARACPPGPPRLGHRRVSLGEGCGLERRDRRPRPAACHPVPGPRPDPAPPGHRPDPAGPPSTRRPALADAPPTDPTPSTATRPPGSSSLPASSGSSLAGRSLPGTSRRRRRASRPSGAIHLPGEQRPARRGDRRGGDRAQLRRFGCAEFRVEVGLGDPGPDRHADQLRGVSWLGRRRQRALFPADGRVQMTGFPEVAVALKLGPASRRTATASERGQRSGSISDEIDLFPGVGDEAAGAGPWAQQPPCRAWGRPRPPDDPGEPRPRRTPRSRGIGASSPRRGCTYRSSRR